ncbi:MAG: hypothetical protein QM764_14445 [Chitinophagaceae bacterium]
MKRLKSGILCLLVFSICAASHAQKLNLPTRSNAAKPKLFKDMPNRLPVASSKLSSLITLKKGQTASVSLADNFTFKGSIVSAASKYNDAIQSIVIKSADYPDATFTISKIKLPDGTINYRGRIVSFTHGDCFELKSENGQYTLVKRNFEDMVND